MVSIGSIGRVAKIGIGAMGRGARNVAGANGYVDEMARAGMSGVDQMAERAAYVGGVRNNAAAARAGYGKFGQAADQIGDALGTAGSKAGGALMSPAGNLAMSAAFIAPMFMGGGQQEVAPAEAEAMQQQQYLAAAQQQAQQQQYQQQQPAGLDYEAALKERLRLAKEEKKLQDQASIINAQQQMYGGY
jgi:hypothetical protein